MSLEWADIGPDEAKISTRALLVTARHEGLRIRPSEDGHRVLIWPPPGRPDVAERWKPVLQPRKAEILEELLRGTCGRCGARGGRLVADWWTDARLCASCDQRVTDAFAQVTAGDLQVDRE